MRSRVLISHDMMEVDGVKATRVVDITLVEGQWEVMPILEGWKIIIVLVGWEVMAIGTSGSKPLKYVKADLNQIVNF